MELALASEVGLEVEQEAIPILEATREVCDVLQLDPLGLIASGSLLIAARPEAAEGMVAVLRGAGVEAEVIGRVVAKEGGLSLVVGGERRELPRFDRDELARFLEEMVGGEK
jgi:hydrogenase maturation factor